jgi:fructokinase
MPYSSPHPVVCFGEVLWDILPSGPLPGGAPMNVAYHLKKLGTHPAMITKIGLDDYGKELLNIFSKSGITTEYFYVDHQHATGIVYAHPNEYNEVAYDIVFPSAWDFIEWKEEFIHLLQPSDFFVYGSLAGRNNTSFDTLAQLLEIANTKVLDINLRPPYYHRMQVEHLLQKANILKMNLAELELISGWFSQFKSVEDRIKLVQDRFKMDIVLVTMGGDGALANDKGAIYRHKGFKVMVADTIGSGDSFLAGFLHQLLNGASVETALTFASAMGAFIATQPGACPQYEVTQIKELIGSANTLFTQ